MSIQNEITRLQGVKSNILAAIEAKNVIVPPGAALADCPDLIAAITGGGGGTLVDITTRRISSEKGICVVDANGNIGQRVTNYYPHSGNTYYNNFAIIINGADFSSLGLGMVQFLEEGTAQINGREYRTVTINGVTWLAENLDYKASGIEIGSGGSPAAPAAWYYQNNETVYGADGNKYGLLYNWHAVKHLNDNRATLIPGWHVPTTAEWDALSSAVGGSGSAGTKLKSTSGWSSGNGTNDYGFSVFPAGYRYSGSFFSLGCYAYFWMATEYSSTFAYYRYFSLGASMDSLSNDKTYRAFSVRLVKDS